MTWFDTGGSTPPREPAAVNPKPWRCYYCGHSKGLIESRETGLIECFCIPACDERRKSTHDNADIGEALTVRERSPGDVV